MLGTEQYTACINVYKSRISKFVKFALGLAAGCVWCHPKYSGRDHIEFLRLKCMGTFLYIHVLIRSHFHSFFGCHGTSRIQISYSTEFKDLPIRVDCRTIANRLDSAKPITFCSLRTVSKNIYMHYLSERCAQTSIAPTKHNRNETIWSRALMNSVWNQKIRIHFAPLLFSYCRWSYAFMCMIRIRYRCCSFSVFSRAPNIFHRRRSL